MDDPLSTDVATSACDRLFGTWCGRVGREMTAHYLEGARGRATLAQGWVEVVINARDAYLPVGETSGQGFGFTRWVSAALDCHPGREVHVVSFDGAIVAHLRLTLGPGGEVLFEVQRLSDDLVAPLDLDLFRMGESTGTAVWLDASRDPIADIVSLRQALDVFSTDPVIDLNILGPWPARLGRGEATVTVGMDPTLLWVLDRGHGLPLDGMVRLLLGGMGQRQPSVQRYRSEWSRRSDALCGWVVWVGERAVVQGTFDFFSLGWDLVLRLPPDVPLTSQRDRIAPNAWSKFPGLAQIVAYEFYALLDQALSEDSSRLAVAQGVIDPLARKDSVLAEILQNTWDAWSAVRLAGIPLCPVRDVALLRTWIPEVVGLVRDTSTPDVQGRVVAELVRQGVVVTPLLDGLVVVPAPFGVPTRAGTNDLFFLPPGHDILDVVLSRPELGLTPLGQPVVPLRVAWVDAARAEISREGWPETWIALDAIERTVFAVGYFQRIGHLRFANWRFGPSHFDTQDDHTLAEIVLTWNSYLTQLCRDRPYSYGRSQDEVQSSTWSSAEQPKEVPLNWLPLDRQLSWSQDMTALLANEHISWAPAFPASFLYVPGAVDVYEQKMGAVAAEVGVSTDQVLLLWRSVLNTPQRRRTVLRACWDPEAWNQLKTDVLHAASYHNDPWVPPRFLPEGDLSTWVIDLDTVGAVAASSEVVSLEAWGEGWPYSDSSQAHGSFDRAVQAAQLIDADISLPEQGALALLTWLVRTWPQEDPSPGVAFRVWTEGDQLFFNVACERTLSWNDLGKMTVPFLDKASTDLWLLFSEADIFHLEATLDDGSWVSLHDTGRQRTVTKVEHAGPLPSLTNIIAVWTTGVAVALEQTVNQLLPVLFPTRVQPRIQAVDALLSVPAETWIDPVRTLAAPSGWLFVDEDRVRAPRGSLENLLQGTRLVPWMIDRLAENLSLIVSPATCGTGVPPLAALYRVLWTVLAFRYLNLPSDSPELDQFVANTRTSDLKIIDQILFNLSQPQSFQQQRLFFTYVDFGDLALSERLNRCIVELGSAPSREKLEALLAFDHVGALQASIIRRWFEAKFSPVPSTTAPSSFPEQGSPWGKQGKDLDAAKRFYTAFVQTFWKIGWELNLAATNFRADPPTVVFGDFGETFAGVYAQNKHEIRLNYRFVWIPPIWPTTPEQLCMLLLGRWTRNNRAMFWGNELIPHELGHAFFGSQWNSTWVVRHPEISGLVPGKQLNFSEAVDLVWRKIAATGFCRRMFVRL